MPSDSPAHDSSPAKPDLLSLNVYEIDDNPFQPRRDFSEPEIASLAESLKEHDMLQPVLVRRVGDRFQLISGERRLRAAIRAGWSTVPARVREADDRLVAELAIVENLQRKDLNPIEKALSFKRYLDEHRCTQDDLAQRLKIDRTTIANLMRLLELPAAVLEGVRRGEVSAGHARAMLPLGDEREQVQFAERIKTEGLSVRDVERMVQERVEELDGQIIPLTDPSKSKRRRSSNDQVSALERELRVALGTKVDIKKTARGSGRIVVHFTNHDEYDRLHDLLTDDGSPIRNSATG
jgi:ParB family chromosome partitioning protein